MEAQHQPLRELSDEQLAQLAAGVNAELYATPKGTPGREDLIRQWAELIEESNRRSVPRPADGKEPKR